MQISNLSTSTLFVQREASLLKQQAQTAPAKDTAATTTSSPSGASSFTPTADELQNGFMGASLARITAAAASGYSYNSQAVLAPSDYDLVEKTTGVTIKNGNFYGVDGNRLSIEQDKNGNLIGVSYDSQGKLVNGNVPAAVEAFNLMNSLENMRDNAMYSSDLPYQGGKAITADDLKAYVKQYQDLDVPLPGLDVISRAENILKGAIDPTQLVSQSNKASAAQRHDRV